MSEADNLNSLLGKTGLWRASSIDGDYRQNCSSGFGRLDKELPGSGWPADGVTELLHDRTGIGEFRLLSPALARLSREQSRWILFVEPPYIPYPPALHQAGFDLSRVMVSHPGSTRDYLWVLEKALASKSCSAVIAWPGKIHEKQVRRLQLAGKEGHSWGILFRHEKFAVNASPAELRIRLQPPPGHFADNSAIRVKILKRKGRWESDEFIVSFEDELLRPMPDFSEMVVNQSQGNPATNNPEATLPAPEAPHPQRDTYQ